MVLLCFLITCSAMDVWDEKAIQNINRKKKEKKKRGQTKHRPAGKFIVNVPFSFFFCLSGFFILSFQNEGKWFVSQNNFKNISGSVEQHADKDYDDDYKDGVGGGLG